MSTRGVTFTPGTNFGAPSLGGVPLRVLLPIVWVDGVAVAMGSYSLTREDVLVACWFAARCGIDDVYPGFGHRTDGRVWKTRWGRWAKEHQTKMWHGVWNEVPDPPTETP